MSTHSLERTSPFGGPFKGYCTKCGQRDLPSKAVFEDCPNTRGLSQDDALIEAITGKPTP